MKKLFYFFIILFTIILFGNLYSQISTAQLTGRVTDIDGKAVIDAEVIIKNLETGFSRGTTTSKTGQYFFVGLPPGKYNVSINHIAYHPQSKDLQLLVGQSEAMDFVLVSKEIEIGKVEVVAKAPAFELRRTDVSMPVRQEQLLNLPLDTRNIMQLAGLVPGIKAYAPIQGRALPEAGSLPPLRTIQLYVDGVEWKNYFNGNIVGIPQTGSPLPQEAVQEFRVVLNAFDPEYTRGTSYVISAVTRRGTNQTYGTAFFNLRDKSLNSRGPFQTAKPDYNRQQFGIIFAGPIISDKLFYSFSYELNNENNFIDVVPGRPSYNPGIWDSYRGTFEAPTKNYTGILKLSYQPNNQHIVDITWATRYMDSKFYFGGTVAQTAGIYGKYHVNSFLLKDTWIISKDLVNELSLHYLRWRHDEPVIKPGPAYIYPSITLGRGTFPIRLAEDNYRIVNKTTYNVHDFYGEHIIKGGFEITRTTSAPWFPYYYDGQFSFATDTSSLPRTATIGIGFYDPYSTNDAEGSLDGWTIGAFVQDRWMPMPTLTLSFGLRWDADINILNNKSYVRWADSSEIASKISPDYLNKGDRQNDLDNFAPRFSFNWDVFGNGTTMLRGGYGIFFDRVPNFIGYFEQLYSKWGIYTFINPGTLDANELRQRILSGDGTTKPTLYLLNKKMLNPAVYQWSVGIAREVLPNLGVSIDYFNNKATALYAQTNANYYIPFLGKRAISDNYGNIYLWGSFAHAFYHGFLFSSLYKTEKVSLQLSYTLSWSYSDYDGVTPSAFPFISSYVRQRSTSDERHRVVLNWIWNLPYGFQFSGIATVASPRPVSVYDGRDLNDNNFYTDDWIGGMRTKTLDYYKIRYWYKIVDLRFSKAFSFKNYRLVLNFEAFNVFNWFNAAGYFGRMYDAEGNTLGNFLAPTSSYDPRYLQFGIRIFY